MAVLQYATRSAAIVAQRSGSLSRSASRVRHERPQPVSQRGESPYFNGAHTADNLGAGGPATSILPTLSGLASALRRVSSLRRSILAWAHAPGEPNLT